MNKDLAYYEDAYIFGVEAEVLSCVKGKKGYEIVLEDTAFYPEGGGQLCDIGTLNGFKVFDVREKDGKVVHYCEGEVEVGSLAKGEIDWNRRYDHMQNHTGEHMVSGIIHQWYGYENVGFHMSDDHILVDYDGVLSEEDIKRVEDLANGFIRNHVDVVITYPDEDVLELIDFRSKKELSGTVRIVEIPGCDICACCGTHVRNTAEVNLIKIVSFEKHKEGTRLELLCGQRALDDYQMKHEQNTHLYQLYSVKPHEVEQAVVKAQQEANHQRLQVNALWKRLLAMRLESIQPDKLIIEIFEENVPKDQLKNFMNDLQLKGDTVVSLCKNNDLYNYSIMSKTLALRGLSKELNSRLQGKGGGSDVMIQGTFGADKDSILAVLKEVLEG